MDPGASDRSGGSRKVGGGGIRSGRVIRKRASPLTRPNIDALVVEALAGSDRPLSAYDLAGELRGRGARPPVMSVYRALDRLVAQRLIQKVETLSAYRLRDQQQGIVLICLLCGRTEAVAAPTEHQSLTRVVREHGFAPSDLALETRGRCADCQADAGDRPPS